LFEAESVGISVVNHHSRLSAEVAQLQLADMVVVRRLGSAIPPGTVCPRTSDPGATREVLASFGRLCQSRDMKISNPAIRSGVYELVKTIEFDLEVGEKFLPTRIEVFEDTQRRRHFRCRMWELEYYHVENTFSSKSERKNCRSVSDEPILVERTWELSSRFHNFEAANAEAALDAFLSALLQQLSGVEH
jgi:hypothetical protein